MTLFLITAPSGAGKTTICNRVDNWVECVSHTTRPMRNGEEHGKTYYFVSRQEFNRIDLKNGFVEKVEYDGNQYGVSIEELEEKEKKLRHVYIIVEYDGYKQIKKKYPDAVGIFLYMSKEDCMANMLLRGDSLESANNRIARYDSEIENRKDYDYVVKNVRGRMNNTISIIKEIVFANIK